MRSQSPTKQGDKQRRNHADYLASKERQDHLLLRLDKGDGKLISQASNQAGLSRSAFARTYLLPVLAALIPRMADIDRARIARAQSLETFIGRALDQALRSEAIEGTPELAAATSEEFDQLFGSSD